MDSRSTCPTEISINGVPTEPFCGVLSGTPGELEFSLGTAYGDTASELESVTDASRATQFEEHL